MRSLDAVKYKEAGLYTIGLGVKRYGSDHD